VRREPASRAASSDARGFFIGVVVMVTSAHALRLEISSARANLRIARVLRACPWLGRDPRNDRPGNPRGVHKEIRSC
jgi:hypothetical protein